MNALNPRGELMNQISGLMDYYEDNDYQYEEGHMEKRFYSPKYSDGKTFVFK